jgi:hypothetical protein
MHATTDDLKAQIETEYGRDDHDVPDEDPDTPAMTTVCTAATCSCC